MNFTFGIVTTNPSSDNVVQVLYSIEQQNIPDDKYEVIIVGGNESGYKDDLLTIIPFDETKKPGWITRKKNIITQNAKFDNIVYMHDYLVLDTDWYKNFVEKFNEPFWNCMTPIKNADGTRYRDWTLWPDDLVHVLGPWNRHYLLPYEETGLSKYMYFSGAYWISKRKVMLEHPLDETLSWGESEDVKWSKEVREKYGFKLNPYSSVSLLKHKSPIFADITPEMLQTLKNYDAIQSK